MWLGIPGDTRHWHVVLLLVLGIILNWREGKEGKEKCLWNSYSSWKTVELIPVCLMLGEVKESEEMEQRQPCSAHPFIPDETCRCEEKGKTPEISSSPSTGFGQTFCHKQIIWLKQHLFVNHSWTSIPLHLYIINFDIVCEQMLALGHKLFAWITCNLLQMACSCSPGSEYCFSFELQWVKSNELHVGSSETRFYSLQLWIFTKRWMPAHQGLASKAQGQQIVLHIANRWEHIIWKLPVCIFSVLHTFPNISGWLLSETGSWAVETCGLIS